MSRYVSWLLCVMAFFTAIKWSFADDLGDSRGAETSELIFRVRGLT
jgi:hypothetical protein